MAKMSDVERGAVLRALRALGLTKGGQFTVDTGAKKGTPFGRVFMQKKEAGSGYRRVADEKFQLLNYHYRDSDWLALKQTIAMARGKASRARVKSHPSAALARGSWVMIADAAGINLADVPGGRISAASIEKARTSRARNDLQKNNGAAVVASSAGKYFITVINRYPAGGKIGFERLLAVKIQGRAKYLLTACKKGFDGSLAQTARLFPGWVLKTGGN